ncbi:hypothetical protein F66182_13179 [Fusarium sp. NRRL 66182]|nr:hypothetical protein F66182_13179 [Fusarium sp. NRRL 66182]
MIGKSFTVAVLLGLNLVSAGPIVKRSVLTDLQAVYSEVQTFDSAITSWNGQLLTALPLLSDVSTLETDIKTATTDTNNSAAFDDADSASIASETESLATLIETTLNDLVAQASKVKAVGLTSTVESSLTELKTLSDGLITALESKIESSYLPAATSVAAAIDSAFATAIATFA